MSEFEAKQLLKSNGISVPDGAVCQPGQAVNSAGTIGYPVTLKVSSAGIAHKTEAGGVALNLKTADEVEAAAQRLSKLADEVLGERMVTGAVPALSIGLTSDPQFGL